MECEFQRYHQWLDFPEKGRKVQGSHLTHQLFGTLSRVSSVKALLSDATFGQFSIKFGIMKCV